MLDRFANIDTEIKAEHFKKLNTYKESLRENPVLKNLFIEMTLNCNQKCLHCGSNAGCNIFGRALTDDEIYLTVLRLKADLLENKEKIPFITVTGGEPLLRPNLPELMKRIRELNYKWGMTSNGLLITKEMAQRLRDADMYSIGLSLDGLEETHNWFRQSSNGYKRVLEAFDNLNSVGQKNVMLTTVVNKRNIKELEDLHKLMKDIGCKTWRIINVDPIGRALTNKDLMLDKEDYQYMIEYIVNNQDDPDLNIIFGCNYYVGLEYERKVRPWYFQCQAGTSVASIQYNGDITACLDIERRPELVFGNVLKDNLYDTWRNEFKIFRQKKAHQSTKCKDCKHLENCDGEGWHTWNFDTHEPRICMLEKLNKL